MRFPKVEVEQTFERSIEALNDIFKLTSEFSVRCGVDEYTAKTIDLAVEETFTNMARHNVEGEGDITIQLRLDSETVTIELIDPDAKPYENVPLTDGDLNKPLSERTPGGLGLHLIRSMMDTLEISLEGTVGRVIMTKKLESL